MSHRPIALAAVEPNVYRPRNAAKPAASFPLPLQPKKQSDYEVVAPLASKPSRPLASAAAAGAPTTPRIQKIRKKYLCETPPAVLHDLKGVKEYDRGRQLGEGGFARCFLVQNKNGTLFAAKTVSKKSLTSPKMKSKFFGELAVHQKMKHPNIVRFVEVFEDPVNIYMILELCHNKSLMDMMRRRKRFTEPEVRFFMLQLMGALKYMHGRNVIHRDLKLGNIFLDEHMNIKIGDFGLAALLVDENERKKTICGTPNYIAPEVLFGGKDGEGHSFEVDLWAVGVIMYAMLVGKPPFQSTDVNSIYKKIKHNSFEWPGSVMISQSAKALVNALLNSDPDARPSLDEIANHNFFKAGLFPKSIPLSASVRPPSSTDAPAKERSGSSPDVIPFGATLSSRVGKPIPETVTSAVLASLLPIINNLSAFTNGNMRSLPPQPFATVEALRSFRRGEKNKAIFIKKWVDYTNKYGMAYMLSDGTCATLYNDNTSMIVDQIGGDRVEWITQSLADPAQAPNGRQEVVFRRLAMEMTMIKQRSTTSKSLKSKLMIWKRTSNYMNNCLGVTEHWGCDRKVAVREPTVDGLNNFLLWVTHYARLRRCVVFRLIDGTIQVRAALPFPRVWQC
ncbi:kinase-like domain-containing protein [Sphaerosporella brunnea]|uniref:Serine/threonine-protein kinase n=1 Tax=Sphaerosporella brunnea TaxID=1250544 RepID=A0A5J5EWL0_9PEZI|nr:kinase-like domain-containing protein [Sphaerosporella brunnea]